MSACAVTYAKLKASPEDHPIHSLYRRDNFLTYMEFGGKQYREPLLYRVHQQSRELDLTRNAHLLKPRIPPPLPPWWPLPEIIFPSPINSDLNKESNNAAEILANIVETSFQGRQLIYTDGSLIKGEVQREVGAGMYVQQAQLKYKWKLAEWHTILFAELFALQKAVAYAKDSNAETLILTDSKAALQIIRSHKPKTYFLIAQEIHHILESIPIGKVKFHWIPGHSQIRGNDVADTLAKEGAQSLIPAAQTHVEYHEIRAEIKEATYQSWKRTWDDNKQRFHLGKVIDSPDKRIRVQNSSRRMEVLFSQLRLGKCKLNGPMFRIKLAESPECEGCEEEENAQHYLINCQDYFDHRNVLKDELRTVNVYQLTLKSLLNDPKTTKAVEKFIKNTNKLS